MEKLPLSWHESPLLQHEIVQLDFITQHKDDLFTSGEVGFHRCCYSHQRILSFMPKLSVCYQNFFKANLKLSGSTDRRKTHIPHSGKCAKCVICVRSWRRGGGWALGVRGW